jgi:hypothetical protein
MLNCTLELLKELQDSKSLQNRITSKKKEMQEAREAIVTDKLFTELQALERLYHIVRTYEAGQSLDGFSF